MAERHIHVRDLDRNHYVIPAARRGEWETFLDQIEVCVAAIGTPDQHPWPAVPTWATMVDVSIADSYAEELSNG